MSDAALDLSLAPPIPAGPTVVTVGTFDGVHRGHWQVLQQVRRRAEQLGGTAVLLTFEPHPLRIVRPEAAPLLLTTAVEKKEILAESGLDFAVFLPFTRALQNYPPERFVEEVLIGRLHMTHLVIGYDHGFGKGRSGDPETLRRIGQRLGFEVEVIEAVPLDDAAISSSRIRRSLEQGDVAAAAAGLGRPYSVRGPVIRGDGRGRGLGFPTANIHVDSSEKLLPLQGIYAVRAVVPQHRSANGGLFVDGVLHLGPRPTFHGSPPTVELHLFDFDADVYGEEIRVDFCGRIREIHNYRTVAELVDAIRQDCDAARAMLEAPASACHTARSTLD